jgi:hypothetical protein
MVVEFTEAPARSPVNRDASFDWKWDFPIGHDVGKLTFGAQCLEPLRERKPVRLHQTYGPGPGKLMPWILMPDVARLAAVQLLLLHQDKRSRDYKRLLQELGLMIVFVMFRQPRQRSG